MTKPLLFTPFTIGDIVLPNRIVVSPMCQYSAIDGLGDDWHVQHLGARAMGGAGIVFTEASHVSAVGRITHHCLGLWNAQHQALLRRLVAIIERGGAVPGVQLAHAGRKASVQRPWDGGAPIAPGYGVPGDSVPGDGVPGDGAPGDSAPGDRGWVPLAPSAIPMVAGATDPHALSTGEIADIAGQFAHAARLAREAGVRVLELHAAHGYLLHSFLSPISNRRNDEYGGDAEGRSRFLMETIDAVRSEWPAGLPLWVRVSCTDWAPGGLTIDDTVALCRRLAARGDVDLIDCSSGGVSLAQHIPSLHPGYQVPFAEAVKHGAGIASGAVGLITEPTHAAEILANGRADVVLVARAMLADPAWPLRAAKALGVKPEVPSQYMRAGF